MFLDQWLKKAREEAVRRELPGRTEKPGGFKHKRSGGSGFVEQLEQRVMLSGSRLDRLATFAGQANGAITPGVILDSNGDLFGTDEGDDATGSFSVFEIARGSSAVTTLASFNETNGSSPSALVLDSNGDLFGTTYLGGDADGDGTVFELASGSSVITILANFNGANGSHPRGLVLDSSGDLFGATALGGEGDGSIFEIAQGSSTITTVANFNGSDGSLPGGVTLDSSGDLFGTTDQPKGIVFEIASGSSSITTIASFNQATGFYPGSLILDSSGDLFGTTRGSLKAGFNGTVFEIPQGASTISTLATFTGTKALLPSGLVLDSSGNLYGTTRRGGDDEHGTVFELAQGASAVTTLFAFDGIDGFIPSGLALDSSGELFGTTRDNIVFQLTPIGNTATTTSIQSSDLISIEGASATFTATVTPASTGPAPTGPVAFLDDGVRFGTSDLTAGGTATFTTRRLPAGALSITARYLGDPTYAQSTSAPLSQSVSPFKFGALDFNYGSSGVTSNNIGLTSVSDVVVQSNGQAVVAGTAGTPGSARSEFVTVARFNTDGSLDPTFGTMGVTHLFVGGNDAASAAALLPDGDILVAATSTDLSTGASLFALFELTSAGALDPSFGGGNGYVQTRFSATVPTTENDFADCIAVNSSGEIFVGGSSNAAGNGQDFAIAAYNPDGTPDSGFGPTSAGTVTLAFTGDDSIASLVVEPDGDLVAAGSTVNASGISSVALATFLPTGTLDTHFGDKGKVVTSVPGGNDAAASSVALAPGNKLVVGGYAATGSAAAGTLSSDFLILRYSANGTLDHTFNHTGLVTTSFNQPAAVTRILVDPDGSIVATGKTAPSLSALDPANLDAAIARYESNGQPDLSFNSTGQSTFSFAATPSPSAVSSPIAAQEKPAAVTFDTSTDLMQAFMQLVQSDQGVGAMVQSGTLIDVGNSDANTVEAEVIVAGVDLSAVYTSKFPGAVLGGAKQSVSVQVTEAGNVLAEGTFAIDLYLSTNPLLGSDQNPFQTFPVKVKLQPDMKTTFNLQFDYPTSVSDGSYYLIATVDTGSIVDLNPGNATVSSAAALDLAQPYVQLDGTTLQAPAFNGTRPAAVSFTVTNNGNFPATKTSAVQILASVDGSLADAVTIVTAPINFNLKPGQSRVFRKTVSLKPSLPPATYNLLALLDPAGVYGVAGALDDPTAPDNLLLSVNTFAVAAG